MVLRLRASPKPILCSAVLCYVILCYVMLCYVMSCYVMIWYVMLCYVMLCYVICCTIDVVAQIFKCEGRWGFSIEFTDGWPCI